jgi:hypothetical protein
MQSLPREVATCVVHDCHERVGLPQDVMDRFKTYSHIHQFIEEFKNLIAKEEEKEAEFCVALVDQVNKNDAEHWWFFMDSRGTIAETT